ncbi:MAG: hypothetical protein KDE27_30450, partial [Planctomycetes bacterium]|nr:hypothetical protein [Planctomycetota bacterium]
ESIADHRDPIGDIGRADDQAFALSLLERAMERLHREEPQEAVAVAMRFGIRCPFASVTTPARSPAIAAALGISSASTARNRVRDGVDRLRSMLRFEIGETVHASDGAEFEATFLAERDLVEDCLEERFPGLWTPNDDD